MPRVHTSPCASATTCTSTCRPPRIARSRNTVASPSVRPASETARVKASASWSGPSTRRMPRPPPPAGGLDHQRVADRGRLLAGRGQVGHRPAAPRGQRYPNPFGQQFGGDLVSRDRADRLWGRVQRSDPQPPAQVGELGLLGHESPTRPHRVGPGPQAAPAPARPGPGTGWWPRRPGPDRPGRSAPPHRPPGRTSPAGRPR